MTQKSIYVILLKSMTQYDTIQLFLSKKSSIQTQIKALKMGTQD